MPDHQGSMFPEPPPSFTQSPPPFTQPPSGGQDTARGDTASHVRPFGYGPVHGNGHAPPPPAFQDSPGEPVTSWAGYALPPDDPTPPPPSPTQEAPIPDEPAPASPPPGPVRSSTSSTLLVVGAIALALVLGVGTTLLVVQPWSASSSADAQDRVGPTVPQQGGVSPFDSSSSTPSAPADPGTQLAQQAVTDESTIRNAVPEGWWVPQVSSKYVGLRADNIVYDDAAIWSNHAALRTRFGAVLLDSSDYASFRKQQRSFWVSIVPSEASSSPESANNWCDRQGLSPDDCYAKRIGQSSYGGDTTRLRR